MNSKIPIEYERGYTKFLNCKIDLRNRVFIPRIETEFWVARAIKTIRTSNIEHRTLKVLDIFAGSGCIGISILKNVKNLLVDFADIDKKAIEQIKINLKLNKIPSQRYRIYQSNLFEKIKNKNYNYIFANPPYVAKERIKDVQLSVLKYEPKTSFLAGKKGFFYIKKFLKEAKRFMKPGGIIYLEIDPQQKDEIKKIFKKEGYNKFKFSRDQFKKHRFVKIENFVKR